ncbi:VCBS domain-containing protein [Hoeflea alexandrii]
MIEDRGLDTSETIIENADADSGMDAVLLAQADTGTDPAGTPPSDPSASGGAPGISVIVPDADNRVTLAASASIEDIQLDGNDLQLVQPDGSQIRIIGGALSVPTFVIGDIEVPQEVLVAALETSGFNVAAGPGNTLSVSPQSPTGSGGEFEDSSGASIAGDGLETLGLLGDTSGGGDGGAAAAFDEDTGNIASVLTGGVSTGGIVESVDNPGGVDADPVAATGSITFFDPDFGETRTAEISASNVVSQVLKSGGSLTAAQLDALLAGFSLDTPGGITVESTTAAGGSIDWTYQVGNEAVDFLAAGDVIRLSFDVQINDGIFTVTQTVTVTVTGTNDVPVIDAVSNPAEIVEAVDADPASNTPAETQTLNATGSLTVTDVDVADVLTGTTTANATGTWNGNNIAGDARFDALIAQGALTFDATVVSDGTQQTLNFTYNVAAADINFLGAGDTVELTFPIQVADNETGADTDNTVTITIRGTNDVPVIDAVSNPVEIVEAVDADPASNTPAETQTLNATGSLTVTDVDVADVLTGTTTANATGTWNGNNIAGDARFDALIAQGALTFDATVVSDGTQQTLNFTYNVAAADINFLGAGDTVELTFPIQVADNETGADTDNTVTITIRGTNDVPVIDAVSNPAEIVEAVDADPASNTPAETQTLNATGSLTVTDVDVADVLTGTTTANATGTWNGNNIAGDARFDALIAQGALTFDATVVSDGTQQTLNFTYNVAAADINFLGAGDTVELTFPIQVADNETGADTDNTVTITIRGTNDVPVIDAVSNPAEIVEAVDADPASNTPAETQTLNATGSLTVTDVDVADVLTGTTTANATGTWNGNNIAGDARFDALIAQGALTFDATVVSDGTQQTLNFTYNVAAADINFLGAGDTVELTFPIQVADNETGADTDNTVTITIRGTNDVPVIDAVSNPAEIVEAVDADPASNTPAETQTLNATGSLTVTDVDVADVLTGTTTANATGTWNGNNIAGDARFDALIAQGALTFDATVVSDGTQQTLNFTYNVAAADINFLGAGDTVELTFPIQVADNETGADTDNTVTITIRGTNDVPVIDAVSNPAEIVEAVDADPASNTPAETQTLNATGSLTVTDVDVADVLTGTTTANATGTWNGNNIAGDARFDALIAQGALTFDATVVSDGTQQTLNFTYNVAAADINFLGAGDTVELTFPIQVADNETGADTDNTVTITIRGTNDVPVIDAVSNPAEIVEAVDADPASNTPAETQTLNATGSLTVTDVDVADVLTGTTTANATGTWNGNNIAGDARFDALIAQGALTFDATVVSDGTQQTLNFTYNVAAADINFLGAGDTVELTFPIQVADNETGADTDNTVTITIRGTNDVPVIDAVSNPAEIVEAVDADPASNTPAETQTLNATGSLTVTDVDVADVLTGTTTANATGTWNGNNIAGDARFDALIAQGALTFDATVVSDGTQQTLNFTYNVAAADINFLGAGDTVELTFPIQVADNETGADTDNTVTITIRGTNDVPVIDAVSNPAEIVEAVDADPASNTPAETQTLNATGSLTVTDVDVADVLTGTTTANATGTWNGNNIAGDARFDALIAQGALTFDATVVSDGTQQTLNFTYNVAAADINFLGAGDTVELTFPIQVADNETGADTDNTVTITIRGTNDVPVIDAVSNPAEIVEAVDADPASNTPAETQTLNATGSLTVTDVDVADVLTGTTTANATGTWNGNNIAGDARFDALIAQGALTFDATVVSDGTQQTLNFTYNVAAADINFLGAGDTVELTFPIQVADNETGADTDNTVTITIRGTNDVPVIDAVSNPAEIVEAVDADPASNTPAETQTLNATGSLTVTDVDVADVLTGTTTANATGTWNGNNIAGDARFDALIAQGALTFDATVVSDGTQQTLNFTYNVAAADINFLGAGDTVELTFPIQVADNETGADTDNTVTITIRGTNDVPVIDAVSNPAEIVEAVDADPASNTPAETQTLNATGSLTVTDVDVADVLTGTTTANATGTWNGNNIAGDARFDALIAQGALTFDATVVSDGTQQTLNFTYNVAAADINFLGAGDTVELTFPIQVADNETGADTDNTVTITIRGTNDVPVIDAVSNPAEIVEAVDADPASNTPAETQTLNATGSLTVTDVDVADVLTGTTTANATGTWNGNNIAGDARFDALIAQGALTFDATVVSDGTQQTLNFTYNVAAADINFLGAGDTVELTFPIQVADNETGADTDNTVTITIRGTNDVPVIDAVSNPAEIVEAVDADPASNTPAETQTLNATGSLTVTDVDVADVLTGTTTANATGTWNGNNIAGDARFDALIAQGALTFDATVVSDGTQQTLNFTYNVAAADINFLGAGDTVELTFPIQVADNETGADTDNTVTITIRGTNDVPVIDAVSNPAEIVEAVDADPASNTPAETQTLNATGSLTVTDVDVADVLTGTTTANATGTWNGNNIAGDARFDALIAQGALTFDATVVSDGTQQTLNFTYNVAAADINFLGAGDTVELTFPIQVADNETGADTDNTVTITIRGTNDVPVIDAVSNPAEIVEAVDADPASNTPAETQTLNATGSLTVTDVDVADVLTGTTTANATGTWNGNNIAGDARFDALIAQGALTFDATVVSDGTQQTLNFTYNVAAADINFLGAGDTVELTFPIQVADNETGADTDNTVTITIRGTNDVPVIDATSVITGSVTESGDIADINEAGFGGSLSSDVVLTAGSQALLDGLQADGSGLEAALTAITTELGDPSQAIAVVWDYLDDNYVNGGPTQDPINEAFIRLGAAYAGLVKAGTISPLVDVTAKYTPDNGDPGTAPNRVQSLHDNLLGNVTSAAIAQRFGGDALETTLTSLVTGVDASLLTRPYFSGNENASDAAARAFDIANGYVEAASGQLTATDVDNGETAQLLWSGNATGTYGTFSIDANTGEWVYKLDNSLASTQELAEGQIVTDSFVATVTDPHLATDTVTVTITITGTNDAPVITDGPVAVTYAEAVDVAGATGQGVLTGGSLTGSLAFNDVDVTDTQTFRVVSATQTSGEIGGYTKPAFEAAALALMSVAGSVSSTGATTGGSINWAFTASDDFFDYLKTGETVEIEYVVEVSDGKGGTATQTITVTVNGANDVLFTDNGETVDLSNAGGLTAADAQDGNYLDAMDGDDIVTLPNAGDVLAGEYGPGKVFNAGNGSDVVNGGDMDDTINGGGGSDQIFGNGGNDDLRGGNNADELHGGTGNDMLSGGSGADRLYGDQDNDTLTGGNGDDLLDGGTGTDTAVYTQAVTPAMVAFVADADPATGGDQIGWTVATGGTEGSDGLIEIEIIQHSGGNILLVGNGGFDSLQAAVNAATAGDTIMIAAGTFAGDTTIDKAVTILGANWGTAGNGARGAESVLEGEIIVTAATGTVVINGVEISNTSGPGAQFDGVTVDGGANVTIENSVFDATSTGGANGDRGIYLTVNATGEVSITQNAFGGAANGHYNTNWNPAIQSDGAGVDLAIDNNSFGPSLGSAIRLATYDEATGSISGNTFTKIAYGLQIDAITGGPVIVSISGNEFNNVIGDINFGNVTSDITIDLSSLETNNFSSSGDMKITTGSGNDDVTGTSGVDTINGGAGSDALTGNGGADTLIGGTDNDTLKGDGGNDTLYGNATNLGVSSNVLAQVGENDVAVFDGVATDYNVTRAVDGSWRVEDIGAGETDSLYGIEGIDFGNDGVDLDLLANVFVFDGAGNLVGTFGTIGEGIAAADAGYTVEVHEGIYGEILTVSEGITLKGVGNVTVDGAGSIALTVNGGGAGQMLSIDNIDFTGAGNQVILVNSSAVYDSISLENGTVTGGKYNGLHVSNATGVAAISLDTVVFTGNATTESGGAGEGPVSFYQYNGDITLTGVTVENPGAAAENGIQFRGVNAPFQPMGTVTLDGVSVTGTYSKVGVAIYNFANANGLNIIGTGLTINVTADWFGLSIDGIDGDLDLSSLPLSVTNAIGTGPQDIGMQGLGGNNVFVGDDSDDLLIGGAGTDTLRGGAGNDYLVDGGGTTFDGGAGVDTVDLSALTGKVTVDLTSGAGGYAAHGATFTEIENVILNAADVSGGSASIVNGSSVDNVIVGSGRDDILSGREGNDTISGNDGNDIIDGGAGADVLSGGAGIDTLRLSVGGNASVIHTVNLTTNTVSGGELTGDTISGFENVTAAHNSTADFTGDGNANVLIGSNNDDILRGMGGDDTLIGDTGYNGGSNADILIGGSGNDALKGGGGSDTLYGNETDLGVASNVLAQSGESDTALYDGVAGDYNVTRETDGSWRVEDIAHGKVDALYGIEGIDFGSNGVDLDLTADVMVFDGSGNLIGTYATIQAAIDAGSTLDGYTVEIHAGTYAENLSVTKALSFVGIGAVTIDPASGTAVTLTGDLGGGNVSIDNIDLVGGTNGIFVETSANAGKLTIVNSEISGNSQHGIYLVGDDPDNDGDAPIVAGITSLEVVDTDFSNNGFQNNFQGAAHVKLFGYQGNALFQGVTFDGATPATAQNDRPDNAVEITGYVNNGSGNPATPFTAPNIGTVVFDDVTVTGAYHKNPIAIFNFSEIDGLSVPDLDLSGAVSNWGPLFNIDGVTDLQINVSGFTITLPAGSDIHTEIQGDKSGQPAVDQTITGTSGNDRIMGKGGNDTLRGGEGDDQLYGADKPAGSAAGEIGDDRLEGGAGNDALIGGGGTDTAIYNGELTVGNFTTITDADPNSAGIPGWEINANGFGDGTDTLTGVQIVEGTDPVGAATGRFLLVGNGGFASIQDAVDAAVDGDTILIAAGTYAENVVVDEAITLIGMGGATSVIIDPASGAGLTVSGNIGSGTVTIDGIGFQGGTNGVSASGAVTLGHLEILNSSFSGNSQHGVFVNGKSDGIGNVTVAGSSFTDNGDGSSNGDGDIVLFEYRGDATIQNVTINNATGTADTAIQVAGFEQADYDVNDPIGTVVIDTVEVNGAFAKVGVYIQGYTNLNGLSLSGLTGTVAAGWGYGTYINPTIDNPAGTPADVAGYPGAFNTTGADGTVDLSGVTLVNTTPVNVANPAHPLFAYNGVVLSAIVNGTPVAETITGTDGNDLLAGGGGNDILNGGDGDDILIGGAGNDELRGGSETDTAVFTGSVKDYQFPALSDIYIGYG